MAKILSAKKPSNEKISPKGHFAKPEQLSIEERTRDIQAFGREIRSSKQTALDFLRKAGIATSSGNLAKRFR